MEYKITNKDVQILFQKDKQYYSKIQILNRRFQVVEEIQGKTISMDMSIDASSDIRRTCNLSLHITDTKYIETAQSNIWIDKQFRIFLGVLDNITKEIFYYPLGIYIITENGYRFSATETTLSLSLVDLTAQYTQERGTQIPTETKIPVTVTLYPCPRCNTNMTKSVSTITKYDSNNNPIINTIEKYTCSQCGFKTSIRPEATATYAKIRNVMSETIKRWTNIEYGNMEICEFPENADEVPYDLEYSAGIYPYNIIKDLRDLYPCYETFFDCYGNFVCRKIPMTTDDKIVLNEAVIDKLIISEQRSNSYSDICNVADVLGHSLKSDRKATKCSSNIYGNTTIYYINIEYIEGLDNDKYYGFTPDADSVGEVSLVFQNDNIPYTSPVIKLYKQYSDSERVVSSGDLKKGIPYVVRYSSEIDLNGNIIYKAYLLGELQIRGIVKTISRKPSDETIAADKKFYGCENIYYDVDKNNPFTCDRIGDICRAYQDGEYDNIITTELAFERGRYENYKTTRLQDSVVLETMLIPFIDVNQKIQYTSPITNQVKQYMINKIDYNINEGTMSLSLTEFYPFYEWDK